jgi:hypothetical protein
MKRSDSMRQIRSIASFAILTFILSGCAAPPAPAPPVVLAPKDGKRIALAQPASMHEGIFLNFASRDFPARSAYEAFCRELKAGLEAGGFTVIDYCATRNRAVIVARRVLPVPHLQENEADIILVPTLEIGYFAATRLDYFKIRANGAYTLIDARTRKVIAERADTADDLSSAPMHFTQTEAFDNMPNVMDALDKAGASLGKKFAQSIH